MRQTATESRDQAKTSSGQRTLGGRIKDGQTMFTRLAGAILRAALMVLLIIMPSVLLPGTGPDTALIVAFLAIFAAAFTLVEYTSNYPSLVEFRHAPPFNRVRFGALFVTVFVLSLILRGQDNPGTLSQIFTLLGTGIGAAVDFPYSPVRLVVLMLPDTVGAAQVEHVRVAAGISYLVSLISLALFVVVLRVGGWPNQRDGFNVWVNLPTFDPTAGGDVLNRLSRDSQINLVLGFLLPFLIPAMVKLAADVFQPVTLDDPHTLIWTMTAWAFLPASLLMRGLALARVAQMIGDQRKRAYAASGQRPQPT